MTGLNWQTVSWCSLVGRNTEEGQPWGLMIGSILVVILLVLTTHPYLQGRAIRAIIVSKAMFGASRNVCLQILQLLLVLQSLQ